ncbi:MAG TPA: serine hydrolase [Sphingobacteriaceae bacterium]
MVNIFLPILIGFKLFAFSPAPTSDNLGLLQKQIKSTLEGKKGTFAVAFKDLSTGEELLINEHEAFHAASTMKTAVLVEAFNQADQGKLSLTDSITVKNSFASIVDGSPFQLDQGSDGDQEIYQMIGSKLPMQDLLYRMIILSSNLATNIVIEKIGAMQVTRTMQSYGAQNLKVLRGVEDSKAYRKGLNNSTTAYDLMLLFNKIALGKSVSSKASETMIRILLDQKFNEIIPANLPSDVRVAHKTGSITGVQHDSGIVMLPDGRRYVLVLLSKDLGDEAAGVKAMARISEMIYKYMTGKRS